MPESREMDSVWSEGVCTVFFGFLHPDLLHSHNKPSAEVPRLKAHSFANTRRK